jgi:hypothetical protein
MPTTISSSQMTENHQSISQDYQNSVARLTVSPGVGPPTQPLRTGQDSQRDPVCHADFCSIALLE